MFEAYAIGVRLTLINGVSSGLVSIIGHFSHLNEQLDGTQRRLTGVHRQLLELQKGVLIGGALTAVGAGGLDLLKGPYEEAKKLAQAKADFRALNLSSADNARAFSVAETTAQKVLGTTISENVRLITDLHTAFGDLHHATEYAPAFAKFLAIAKVRGGEHAGDGLVYNAVKALEHRGGKVMGSTGAFNTELDLMSKVFIGSGGRVGPADYFHASQTGKLSYSLADKEFLYGPFAAYMQAKSGKTAGTAMMTSFMSLAGGHMDNKAKGFFASIGLGDQKGLHKDLAAQFAARPDKFIWEVLEPAIKKRFGMDMTNKQIAELIARNTNRYTGDFLGWFILNQPKAHKDTAIFNKSLNYTQSYDLYRKTPEGAEQAFGAGMANLKAIIGTAYLPMIVDGLTRLAPVLMRMADWANNNQGLIKVLAAVTALISTAAMMAGSILLTKAAFRGLAMVLGAAGVGVGDGVGGIVLSVLLGELAAALGVVAAALFAVYKTVRLFDAFVELWNAKHSEGVVLSEDSKSRPGLLQPSAVGAASQTSNESPWVAGRSTSGQPIHTTVNIDGKPVAKAVTFHQAVEASRAQSGLSGFDPGMAMPPMVMPSGY